ncbi:MAG TPA: 5'/3'-nucleotidase SurE [Streptosporangiaceae bacterium]
MLRVLLTNDDGVRAAGIRAVRAALTGVCASVVTVAPDGNRSGFARKCTFDRPVGVRRLEGGPHPVFECDGTPTDCVRAGLLGGLAAEADLVVSGINHGANVADDVVYSGTIGAGLEAAVLGTSALCLSQQTPTGSLTVNYADAGDYDFGLAARHGAALAATILRSPPAGTIVLSVNYPADPAAPAPGAGSPPAVLTRPGQRVYPRAPVKDWDSDPGPQALYLFGEPDTAIPEADGPADTDVAAIRRGLISVTPLSEAIGLNEYPPAMASFLARLPVSTQWPQHRP